MNVPSAVYCSECWAQIHMRMIAKRCSRPVLAVNSSVLEDWLASCWLKSALSVCYAPEHHVLLEDCFDHYGFLKYLC